jgi:hypothetical protein
VAGNDITGDGKIRVYYVPSIANQNAPTTTELNAGTDLTATMTADGLSGFQPDTADVDTSSLASVFNSTRNGRTSFSNTQLTLKRQSGTDTIFNLLTRDTTGFIVIRRSISQSTAWASSQGVEVYPIVCEETARMDPAPNTVERYVIGLKITDGTAGTGPSLRASVA